MTKAAFNRTANPKPWWMRQTGPVPLQVATVEQKTEALCTPADKRKHREANFLSRRADIVARLHARKPCLQCPLW